MSKTRQVFESLFNGEGLTGGKKKQHQQSSFVSASDFAASNNTSATDTSSQSVSSSILSKVTSATNSLVDKAKTVITGKVIAGAAITTGLTAAAGALYVSSLRSQAEATWALLLDSTAFSASAAVSGGKMNKSDSSSSSSSSGTSRMHLFFADPSVSRHQHRNRTLHTATQAQQPLTVNLAAALFLKECDAECRRRIKSGAPTALFSSVASSMWARLPVWIKLQLWNNWMRESSSSPQQNDNTKKNSNRNLPGARHVVVVLTEHARLPCSFGVRQMANRVVEVGFPVLGEVSVHSAVDSGATAAASSSSSPCFSLFLRLFFQHRHTPGSPLQNLIFSDCAGPGDAAQGEDPQDIRVSAPQNLGVVTVARYASTSSDDAPYPLVSVEEHAKISLLPPFPAKSGSGENSNIFPARACDPPDVLVQKTRFRRAVNITVYRRALDAVPATAQRYDRTAAASSPSPSPSASFSGSSSSIPPTLALGCAFVVITVSNVAARVTSCQLDRRPLEPLGSQEQTAAVVRKLSTTTLAAAQASEEEGSNSKQQRQRQQQQRNVTSSMTSSIGGGGGGGGNEARSAGALSSSGNDKPQQHFVFPIVRPFPDQLLTRLEKPVAEQQQQQQQQNTSPRRAASPTASSASASSSSASQDLFASEGPGGSVDKRRVFPLSVEFEFEHSQYIPRRAAASAAASPAASLTASINQMNNEKNSAGAAASLAQNENENEDDDDDETGFGFVTESIRAAKEQQQQASAADISHAERRRQQQQENKELSIKAALVWCAVGEPPSAVHVRRCGAVVANGEQQKKAEEDSSFRVRVLREAWYSMQVPVSF